MLRRREGDGQGENGYTHRRPNGWQSYALKVALTVIGAMLMIGVNFALGEFNRLRDAGSPSKDSADVRETLRLSDQFSELNTKVEKLLTKVDDQIDRTDQEHRDFKEKMVQDESRLQALEIIVAGSEARRKSRIGS